MFPDPCGEAFERAVATGADPRFVVPDEYFVVRGGTSSVPPAGDKFSCSAGPILSAAACAVPYNQCRVTTAGAVRAAGGSVVWAPEFSRNQTLNKQHVHVIEGGPTVFSTLQPNPVPKADRIDKGK